MAVVERIDNRVVCVRGEKKRAIKMALSVKALPAEPESPSVIPRTHMMEREHPLPQIVL